MLIFFFSLSLVLKVRVLELGNGLLNTTTSAGLKNDCACVWICGKERRLKRAPIQNDCRFAGNKQAAFKSKK